MPPPMNPSTRVVIGVVGVAVLVFGLWLSLISLIVGIVPQMPNPFAGDGDPCCSIPDTWEQTRAAAFWGWLWLGVALIVTVTGVLLIVGASRGRFARWRWLPIGVAALMAVAGAAIVVTYVRLHALPGAPRCRQAPKLVANYRRATDAQREELSDVIAKCRLLSGRTQQEVIDLLGAPPRKTYASNQVVPQTWHYGRGLLTVRFEYRGNTRPSQVSSVFVDE